MIRTVYRRPDAAATPAPAFDELDPLTSQLPLAPCLEEPDFLDVVAALGDPALVDERVRPLDEAPGLVVAGDVVDPDDVEDDDPDVEEEHPRAEAPPTVPIPIRPTTAIPVTGRGGRKRRAPSARRAAS